MSRGTGALVSKSSVVEVGNGRTWGWILFMVSCVPWTLEVAPGASSKPRSHGRVERLVMHLSISPAFLSQQVRDGTG